MLQLLNTLFTLDAQIIFSKKKTSNTKLYLVQQNNVFKRRPKFMFHTKLEALKVDNKCKKFSSFDVFEELVTHANVDVSALHKSRQVSNRYLQHRNAAALNHLNNENENAKV